MKKLVQMSLLAVTMMLPFMAQSQSIDYLCTFENPDDTAGWVLLNGSQANPWYIDSLSADTGNYSLYISSDNGATNTYNTSSTSITYAYRAFDMEPGAYSISYNWRGYGESSYDFLRVFLAPSSAHLSAGVLPDGSTASYSFGNNVPTGWIALDGALRLNMSTSWELFSCDFAVSTADTYYLVFLWCNDGSGGSNPPAAVDNIYLTQPSCPAPILPYVTNITNTSFDINWTDVSNGNALSWIVEVDSATQTYGQGSVYYSNDTTISITGLTPNTNYTLYIRSYCGGTDTSNALVHTVRTPCEFLSSLPYFQNFESSLSGGSTANYFVDCWNRLNDASLYFGWPYVTNSTSASHNGGAKGLYWYNSTSVASYGNYQCVVLPGLDTDEVSIRNTQLTFWAKMTSSSYRGIFEVGVMTDPNDIASFTPLHIVRVNTTDWERFIIPLSGYTGNGCFVAVKAEASTGNWYAYLDEFTLERIPPCPSVLHLTASNTGTTGTLLTWDVVEGTPYTPNSFQINVNPVGSTATPLMFTSNNPRFLVTGLQPGVMYRAWVRAHCTNDSLGVWDSVTFKTRSMPCAVVDSSLTDTFYFSSGTTQSSGVPVNSGWGNTLCQSIYTASELNAAGIFAGHIQGVDYSFTTNSSYAKLFSIYITTTERSTYSSTSDMVTVRTEDLVYGPAAHPLNTSGTVHYDFTEPFEWDGVSNIVITTMMNQPNGASHSSSGFYGYSTSAGATRTIYRYQDGTQYTPANSTSGSGNGTSSYRPSINFYTMECSVRDTCSAATVILDRVDVDTVSISWIPGSDETSWTVIYREADSASWITAAADITTNHYTFTNLLPMRSYLLRVLHECGGDTLFTQVAFTTPCVSVVDLPFTEDFESFVASSSTGSPITDCWHRGTNYTYTNYPYLSTSYAHSGRYAMYMYNPGSTYYSYLALPPMATSIDSLQISFAAYRTGTYSIKVGVMTDPEDYGTFTEVAAVSPTSTGAWESLEVPLNSYTGDGKYIALVSAGSSAQNMYIDDIEVDVIPNCPRPREINISNITTNTAVVNWTDTNATYFEIEYGPSGFTLGTGTRVNSMLGSVTLYGLTHSTRYDVYVRSFCTTFDTSLWSFPVTFITECDIITTLPYTQNFSGWGVGTGARPACWECGGYSSYPYILNVTDAGGAIIGQTLNLYSYTSNRVYASLPEIDSVSYPINILQTVFTAWTNATFSTSYSHDLIVGVCSTQGDMSTFTPIDTILLTDTPTEYEVAFNDAIGAGKYITFVSTCSGTAYYNYAYLDSVSVELIPPCQSPNNLSATNIMATSATLSWNDRGGSLEWQVEYTQHGFAIGSGTRVITTSNPLTVTGLLPSSTYDFYVRAICGPGDTSLWSRTPYTFMTLQNPATVPYFYDFEVSTEWDNWQTISNSPINWYRGEAAGNGTPGIGATGTHAMYISADSGATCSTHTNEVVNAVAYRDIDFGNVDSTYILSFRASAGGCRVGNSVYDGLAVFLVDPNEPFDPPANSPLESPWGNVNNLSLLTTVYSQPNWNTYTVIIDTIYGLHRLVFYWFNQNTTTIGTFFGLPAVVDDISIQYASCPRPAGIRTTNVTMASAHVVWHGHPDVDYRVTLRNQAGAFVASELVHTNSAHFTSLTPGTTYTVYVRRLCSETDSSMLPSYQFTTLFCNEGVTDTIGNTSTATTSYNVPLCNYYNYSYTQQIVSASEMTGSAEIVGINFYYSYANAMTSKTNCTIYMGHTTLNSFGSASDFVDPDSMQIVYTGALNCSQGWNHFMLSHAFSYDGRRNLVVAIDDNSGQYNGSSYTFLTSPSSGQTTIAYWSDSENPDATSGSGLSGFSGTRNIYAFRSLMSFDKCPPSSCPLPLLRNPIIRRNNVTLRWRNTGTNYQVGYRLLNNSSWITNNYSTTDTFYVINTVYPVTDYVYHVRQYCDTTGVSNWAEGQFNSEDIPCLTPMGLHTVSVSHDRAKIAWEPEENNISYRVRVFNTYFDREITRYSASYTITGLESNTRYYATVQASCQNIEEPSEWSDTISFVTDACPDATNLTASNILGNSVELDWTEGGIATEWEIQWGMEGFAVGTGGSVVVDHHPYMLTGLTGETTYDIYVRGICGSNFYSENWSNVVTITTQYSDIHSEADDARVSLFPNPTSADVEILIPAVAAAVRVEIIDMAGRTQLVQTLPCGTERATLATSQLSQGAYYVRVVGGELNTIKKLIVR